MTTRKQTQWHRGWRRCIKHLRAYLHSEGRVWLWFGFALAGVLAKGFFEQTQSAQPYRLTWTRTIMALVVTLVTFRATFEQYKDVRSTVPLLVQASLAFQCGFFWQTVFNDLPAAR